MISGGVPFIGMIHNFMDDECVHENNLGPVRFYAMSKFATSVPPDDKNDKGFPVRAIIRWVYKLLIAKICGQNKPNVFFDDDGKPVSEPIILNAVNK
jgi:hypothetical protein